MVRLTAADCIARLSATFAGTPASVNILPRTAGLVKSVVLPAVAVANSDFDNVDMNAACASGVTSTAAPATLINPTIEVAAFWAAIAMTSPRAADARISNLPRSVSAGSPSAMLTALFASALDTPVSTRLCASVVSGVIALEPIPALSTTVFGSPVSILVPPITTIGPLTLYLKLKLPTASVVVDGSRKSNLPFLLTSMKTFAPAI